MKKTKIDPKIVKDMCSRAVSIRADSVNEDERSFETVITTENRVTVVDWSEWRLIDEILLSDGLEMPNNGDQVPLLDSHMRENGVKSVLGSMRNVKVTGKEIVGRGVLAEQKAESDEAWNLIRQGHLTDISAGYRPVRYTDIKVGEKAEVRGQEYKNNGERILRVVDSWKLKEASLVPIGADEAAKIREENLIQFEDETKQRSVNKMPDEVKTVEKKGITDQELKDAKLNAAKDAAKAEQERIREITALGKTFDLGEEADKAISDGVAIDAFRQMSLKKLEEKRSIDSKANTVDLSEKEQKEYSLLRAFHRILNNEWETKGCLEKEVTETLRGKSGKDHKGQLTIPSNIVLKPDVAREVQGRMINRLGGLPQQQRELTASGISSLIGTDHLASQFIDLLRNQVVLFQVGARFLTGLQGSVSIPKQTGAATAYWVADSGNITPSDQSFGSVTLSPKTVGAATLMSRRTLLQTSPAIEALVMDDLTRVIGLAIDLAGIAGTGANNQPTGITQTNGIGSVTGASLDWDAVVEFETDVAAANADIGSMYYLTRPAIRGIMKTREKASNTAQFLMDGGQVNGYPVAISNQCPAQTMIFGVFSQLLVGMWSGLDVLIDPYTSAADGGLYIWTYQDVDIAVRHAAAFSVASDID
jgi:HK97 family phage major capsid protein